MNRPTEAVSDSETRVLLAVLAGATTYPELRSATGLSNEYLFRLLRRLREQGLVGFEDGRKSTLHPTCQPVPFGVR
ncbi:MAG: hypothetical protein V4472_24910 [Pseudomonadota bacterium]